MTRRKLKAEKHDPRIKNRVAALTFNSLFYVEKCIIWLFPLLFLHLYGEDIVGRLLFHKSLKLDYQGINLVTGTV